MFIIKCKNSMDTPLNFVSRVAKRSDPHVRGDFSNNRTQVINTDFR